MTAKPGIGLSEIQKAVDEEIERLIRDGITERELARSKNSRKSDFIYGLQSVGGKAEQLNSFNVMWGDPAAINRELDRYAKVTLEDVRNAASTYLTKGRAILSVVPMGKKDLEAKAVSN